uniref:Invertebrate defensins family profile domain-containing protein n=1 Tax=Anopheles farauti TaxID=69004 RepID=A0A182R0V4_9DIPT
MRTLQLATLFEAVMVVLLLFSEMAFCNPLTQDALEVQSRLQPSFGMPDVDGVHSRSAMVQTLTCTNPNCLAQCRGRGYRRGSCNIGRCFCSYV